MATSPVTPIAPVHPAWYSRAATWLLKVGVAVKNGILKVAGASQSLNTELQKVAPTLEELSNLVVAGSGTFEQHVLDVWGVVASAAKSSGDAASANGLSITFDAALIKDIKAILPAVEAFLHPQAGPAAPGS